MANSYRIEIKVFRTSKEEISSIQEVFKGKVKFVDFDTIIKVVTKNAPFDPSVVYPAIPLIVYFLIGMVATTAISPSIEGKNIWIMQILPIEKKVIYQCKCNFTYNNPDSPDTWGTKL